jgi:hypothetical protein
VSLDEQVRQALDRALTGARGHLEADLRALAQDLLRAAADERTRAVADAAQAAAAEVRQKAHAQLADIRDAAERHTDDLRRTLEEQIAALRRALAAAETRAQADIDDARRLAQTQVDDVQRVMAERVAELQHRLSETERRLQHTGRERDEARQAEDEQASRLAHAVRMLDEAASLGEVLDALAKSASREAERVALFIVRAGNLTGWATFGFGVGVPPTRGLTVELDDAGVLATVVRSGSAEPRSTADISERAQLPAFASAGDTDRSPLALPVVVGGAAVAVLYADRAGALADDRRWSHTLDVLARHASKVLEALTIQQAAGVRLPAAVTRASHDAVAGLGRDRGV